MSNIRTSKSIVITKLTTLSTTLSIISMILSQLLSMSTLSFTHSITPTLTLISHSSTNCCTKSITKLFMSCPFIKSFMSTWSKSLSNYSTMTLSTDAKSAILTM